MPELPEVETVMRALTPLMQGRRIARVTKRTAKLRTSLPDQFENHLTGQTIQSLSRRAKYILMHLSNDHILIIHLGMTGGFHIRNPAEDPQKHDHVIFDLDSGARLSFHDPRRFGFMDLASAADLPTYPALASLGPEPLGDDFTPPLLASRLKNKKTPIKTALLDQHVVAGLGNIYVAEALFQAGIHPERHAGGLTLPEIERLVSATKTVLHTAIQAGGSTLRDYRQPDGEFGLFQDQFAVYGRAGQACPGCTCKTSQTGGITRIVQASRSTFYCARKQK